jgi:hypothetical protein
MFDDLDHDLDCQETTADILTGKFDCAVKVRQFMRAGKAVVTLKSLKSGARFTYRLTVSEDKQAIFVGLMSGPDNNSHYKYIGRVARDIFWAGRKVPRPGDISPDAPGSVAFAWAWRQLATGNMPATLEVWHEGRCGRCARRLTVPESIASGFGPECAGRMG